MFQGRYFHSTAINSLNGDVYVFGGSADESNKLSDVLVLTPDDKFVKLSVFNGEESP